MIYIAILALILAGVGFYRRQRSQGFASTLLDTIVAALVGWLSGLLIGIGARVGMSSIPFFNGTESRLTFDGTVQVILVFSLYGIGLGIIYELLFRRLLKNRGLLFGLLVTVIAAFPLASAALQQISFVPSLLPTIGFALLFVGAMFIPFAVALELLLSLYHRIHSRHPSLSNVAD